MHGPETIYEIRQWSDPVFHVWWLVTYHSYTSMHDKLELYCHSLDGAFKHVCTMWVWLWVFIITYLVLYASNECGRKTYVCLWQDLCKSV